MTESSPFSWGVIFDVDGVIVDTNFWHRKAILDFCKRHHDEILAFDEQVLRTRIYGFPNRTWIPMIFATNLDSKRVDRLAEEKEEIFRSLIRGSITPLEGLQDFLDELVKFNVPIAVASSAPPENIYLMLNETKLDRYFSVVLDDTSVAQGKPAPDIYLKAAKLIGIQPGRCFVFEDSLAGIDAARKAGCIVIGVATTHPREELSPMTELVIDNFCEISVPTLLSLIEQILKRT